MIDFLLDRITPKTVLNLCDHPAADSADVVSLSIALARWRLRAKSAVLETNIPRGLELAEECAELAAPLATIALSQLNRDAALAVWLNLYNALVAHAFLRGPHERAWRRPRGLYRRFAWRIAGSTFTPDQIEHGVLRANRGHRRLFGPSFGRWDRRLAMVLGPFDPRIHAALHCGAESCPPVQVYRSESLEEDLSAAFSSLVKSSTRIEVDTGRLRLHPILYDYRADFGGEDELKRQAVSILGLDTDAQIKWQVARRELSDSPSL
jgi:Protein of unknown function, DUF547